MPTKEEIGIQEEPNTEKKEKPLTPEQIAMACAEKAGRMARGLL